MLQAGDHTLVEGHEESVEECKCLPLLFWNLIL